MRLFELKLQCTVFGSIFLWKFCKIFEHPLTTVSWKSIRIFFFTVLIFYLNSFYFRWNITTTNWELKMLEESKFKKNREWYARRQKETTFSKAVFLKLSDNWWKKSLMELHFGKIVVWKLLCLLYLKMILLQITFLANWNFLISNKLKCCKFGIFSIHQKETFKSGIGCNNLIVNCDTERNLIRYKLFMRMNKLHD